MARNATMSSDRPTGQQVLKALTVIVLFWVYVPLLSICTVAREIRRRVPHV